MKTAIQISILCLGLVVPVRAAQWANWESPVGNGHFYTVTDSAMTWFDARGVATDLGGYLTSIGSLEELNFIRTSFGRTELFWTGLSTINGNGSFEWDDGEPLTFTYFGAYHPDATQLGAVVINSATARGFTRGSFRDVNLSTDPIYRGVIERDTDPNAQNPPIDSVPDGGSTLALFGIATFAFGAWKRRRG